MRHLPQRWRSAALSQMLLLAAPLSAATFTVMNTADSGPGSLRQAILDANASAGTDTIAFAIPGSGVHTIQLSSPLPAISDPVAVDGYTQPGSSPNTLSTGDNAVILVEIDGASAGTLSAGLLNVVAAASTIRGLAIINAQGGDGISLTGGGSLVAGSFIGLRPDGTTSAGNGCAGVRASSSDNIIGGSSLADRNLISGTTGCGIDVVLTSTNNLVVGNYIGTNSSGMAARGGTIGIDVTGTSHIIGGTSAGSGNLISGHSGDGIRIRDGSSGNLIRGNFIGTNATGTAALGNLGDGVSITDSSSNTVGGSTVGAGNLISGNNVQGNSTGIRISAASSGNSILGNLIGTDVSGTVSIPNTFGLEVLQGQNNVVGGTIAGARNVISGNDSYGLFVGTSDGTQILGNFIGTDITGSAALPNHSDGVHALGSTSLLIGSGTGAGRNVISANSGTQISLRDTTDARVRGNSIGTNANETAAFFPSSFAGVDVINSLGTTIVGGTTPGDGNTISGHIFGISADGGTFQIFGNWIGMTPAGLALPNSIGIFIRGRAIVGDGTSVGANVIAFSAQAGVSVLAGAPVNLPTTIRRNRIFGNGIGIDLGPDGPTPNDPGDVDSGANGLQNFPVIRSTTVDSSNTTIVGSFNSMPSTAYTLEFYSNSACSPSSYGEGKTFLGSAILTTDAFGNASFNLTFPTVNVSETVITATATDPNGNSSEFSACATVPASFYSVTPCRVADTRGPAGPYGGPALAANADRNFVIGGQCGIPATAASVAFNFTVTQPTGLGDLRTVPGGGTLPLVSTMNWRPGQTRANNAVVPLGPFGDLLVHVDQASGTVDFIIDVTGYFQ